MDLCTARKNLMDRYSLYEDEVHSLWYIYCDVVLPWHRPDVMEFMSSVSAYLSRPSIESAPFDKKSLMVYENMLRWKKGYYR